MRLIVFVAVFGLSVLPSHAERVFLGSSADSSGRTFRWWVDIETVAGTASWNGADPAPFDLPKLIDIAHDYAARHTAYPDAIRVDAVYLQRVDRAGQIDALRDKWFLVISFASELGALPKSVRLLPDGTIVEPIIDRAEREGEKG
jgi:hypothetical protein